MPMMTVFANVMSAPIECDSETTREDILHVCRLFREDRVARFCVKEQPDDTDARPYPSRG